MEFGAFVKAFEALVCDAAGRSPAPPGVLRGWEEVRTLVILAPHPDDECLMAGFALRALQEWNARVVVVPFSFGSRESRRQERRQELERAVLALGFELWDPRSGQVPGERTAELTPKEWVSALQLLQPDGIVFPHAEDGHPTHQRCSQLVADVVPLWVSSSGKRVHLFQTGYWQDLPDPNLFIELSAEHVIRMGTALLEHRGEVSRNPYHLGLPSHLADSRRKGIERVAGMGSVDQGGCVFAQLYHHSIKS